jgi:D-arabinose 1-dehydrogenase-like Zn-dependent alcohol dehydrogenase
MSPSIRHSHFAASRHVTAWQMLERAHVAPGQTVVIHGAAGNVGAFAAQIGWGNLGQMRLLHSKPPQGWQKKQT